MLHFLFNLLIHYHSFYLQIKSYKFMCKIRDEALKRKGGRGVSREQEKKLVISYIYSDPSGSLLLAQGRVQQQVSYLLGHIEVELFLQQDISLHVLLLQ